ncbi:MAG TPA: hypothetical protein VM537_29670 [Anaerolineae bacterium]|nr:hypothetical protein [Anaerolineae bacterium]
MPDTKISAFTANAAPVSTDEHAGVQGGANVKTTSAQILRSAPDGTIGAPGVAFESDPDSGFYKGSGVGSIDLALDGVRKVNFGPNLSLFSEGMRFQGADPNPYMNSGTGWQFAGVNIGIHAGDPDNGFGYTGTDEWYAMVGGDTVLAFDGTGATPQGLFHDGSAALPSITFAGYQGDGFHHVGPGEVGVSVADSRRFSFVAAGIQGNQSAGGIQIISGSSSATVPGYSFFGDLDTGVGVAAADQLSLIAGGVEGLRVTEDAGNVMHTVPDGTASNVAIRGASMTENTGLFFTGSTFQYSDSGVAAWVTGGTVIQSGTADGPRLRNESASATNPTLIPDQSDDDTGVGQAADDQLSLIAGGVEGLRVYNSRVDIVHNGTAALPALTIGDADTGFYADSDDSNSIRFSAVGTAVGGINIDGIWCGEGGAQRGMLLSELSSSTNPSIVSHGSTDKDTGIGRAADDQLSLIAGGVEIARCVEGAASGDYMMVEEIRGNMYEYGSANTITVTTAGTYYGWTTAVAAKVNGMTADTADATADHFTIVEAGEYEVKATVSFGGTGNSTVRCAVHVDGVINADCPRFTRKLGAAGDIGTAAPAGTITLAAGEEVSLRFTSDGNGDSVDLEDVSFSIRRLGS